MTALRSPFNLGWASIALLVVCACTQHAPEVVHVRYRGLVPLSAAEIRYEPSGVVSGARVFSRGFLAIERGDVNAAFKVLAPGFCPLVVKAGPQASELQLSPVIDLGGDRSPLGFDAPFVVAVKHGCPETGRGHIRWQQVEGPALRDLRVSADGFRLSARTASLAELHPEPLPSGIVAFSPRTQGRVVLEARWQRGGEPALVRTLSLAATSRASGLSSVAVSQQLVLGGAPYKVKSAPQAGHATALPSGAYSVFTPDAPGRWVLERENGTTLSLQALWHDRTPYDCGRSECHTQIASTTETSPMSHALERQLPASAAVGCMLDCHVTGERGLSDGGFLAVSKELGFSWMEHTRWQDLPQTLRRLGGVRCTACHGPGAIPEPEGRDAILRSDVCATCHDAPPRYPQVSGWRASRMARADAEPRAREGSCAECHTTSGFLAALGVRRSVLPTPSAPQPAAAGRGAVEQRAVVPAQRSPLTAAAGSKPTGRLVEDVHTSDAAGGITCAACHAPHDGHRAQRLVRDVNATPLAVAVPQAKDATTALCLSCHTSKLDVLQPSAAAGPLVFGHARVPAPHGESGAWRELRGPAPHAAVPRGCIGCHGTQPGVAKLDHSFRVDARTCKSCHANRSPAQLRAAHGDLRERAQRILHDLAPHCEATSSDAPRAPLHAASVIRCRTEQHTRARYLASLVLEDPAADAHNPAFARELLQEAEQQSKAPIP